MATSVAAKYAGWLRWYNMLRVTRLLVADVR